MNTSEQWRSEDWNTDTDRMQWQASRVNAAPGLELTFPVKVREMKVNSERGTSRKSKPCLLGSKSTSQRERELTDLPLYSMTQGRKETTTRDQSALIRLWEREVSKVSRGAGMSEWIKFVDMFLISISFYWHCKSRVLLSLHKSGIPRSLIVCY